MMELLKSPIFQRNILFIGFIIALILYRGCGSDKTKIMEYEQNIIALKDSVRVYSTKTGELIWEKSALIGDLSTIENLNSELSKEVKHLKDNPIVVTRVVTRVVHDTVKINVNTHSISYSLDSSEKTVKFTFDTTMKYDNNNWRKIGGEWIINTNKDLDIKVNDFKINSDEINLSFTTGLTESKDGVLEIFIKSDYPNFKPSQIDGALIDPRESKVIKKYFPPKRWGVSPYVGYGVYMDFQKARIGHGVTGGVALTYDIIQWSGKK
jgi:hypothetical protein